MDVLTKWQEAFDTFFGEVKYKLKPDNQHKNVIYNNK